MSTPPARRETTGPPPFSAPRMAQASIPLAMPDTTRAPPEASSRPKVSAAFFPYSEGSRVPTTPMAASSSKRKVLPRI